MISNIIRKFLTFLSFPEILFDEKLTKKNIELSLELKNKASILKKNNRYRLQTHNIFSSKILKLISKGDLRNFLRFSYVQKMFFVHNRIYLYFQLKKILKNKKLINLLPEVKTGNPVPYFLFKSTSGNKIRHVFHLHKYLKYNSIKTDLYIEFGGGYGCMASVIQKHTRYKNKYIIFDTKEVTLIQYYYLKSLGLNVGFNDYKCDIILISEINELNKILKKFYNKKKFFISNWAFSEIPLSFRKKLIHLLSSEKFLISFQSNFENIDNIKYFNTIKKNIKNSNFMEVDYMNIFQKNKHYYYFK
jgi:hypothetical protein